MRVESTKVARHARPGVVDRRQIGASSISQAVAEANDVTVARCRSVRAFARCVCRRFALCGTSLIAISAITVLLAATAAQAQVNATWSADVQRRGQLQ
jgi:hypothetical protein